MSGVEGEGRVTCSSCGAPFACGRDDPAGCWCAALPALPRERYEAGAGCLCEACLRALVEGAAGARPAG